MRAPAYVALGLGTVALGGFALFGISGRNRYDALIDRCAPNCPEDEAREVRKRLVAADISLVVGLVSLGIGGISRKKEKGARP